EPGEDRVGVRDLALGEPRLGDGPGGGVLRRLRQERLARGVDAEPPQPALQLLDGERQGLRGSVAREQLALFGREPSEPGGAGRLEHDQGRVERRLGLVPAVGELVFGRLVPGHLRLARLALPSLVLAEAALLVLLAAAAVTRPVPPELV